VLRLLARTTPFFLALLVVAPARAAAPASVNPQTAGLQVALRAYGLYRGDVDGVAGPATVRAVRAFQRRSALPADGRAGASTRAALGPLGRPLFGRRTLRRGMFGWDVSVLQFLLARAGFDPGAIGGYLNAPTARALRRYQRTVHLRTDAVAGPATVAALTLQQRVPLAPRATTPRRTAARADPFTVRAQLDLWSGRYGVDPHLARALAWMESGYRRDARSSAGASGVMQLLPETRDYVEQILIGRRVRHRPDGDVQIGIAYLRHLLREFHGNVRLALAGWYQGDAAVRRHGLFHETRAFVRNVLALRQRM
jgi:hypothetical protein